MILILLSIRHVKAVQLNLSEYDSCVIIKNADFISPHFQYGKPITARVMPTAKIAVPIAATTGAFF